jgi:hypothetical protein
VRSDEPRFQFNLEAAKRLLRKELEDFNKSHPVPSISVGRSAGSVTESQEFQAAEYFLRHYTNPWREHSLACIEKRVAAFVKVADVGSISDPGEWSKVRATEVFNEVYPLDGSISDRALNSWLCSQLQVFVDAAVLQPPGVGSTDVNQDSENTVNRVATPISNDQFPLREMFKGQTVNAKLKHSIAMHYINCNPSQAKMVAWLELTKKPILGSWTRRGLHGWMDAFRKQPNLVKRFLSGITGKLRKHGYRVGQRRD